MGIGGYWGGIGQVLAGVRKWEFRGTIAVMPWVCRRVAVGGQLSVSKRPLNPVE